MILDLARVSDCAALFKGGMASIRKSIETGSAAARKGLGKANWKIFHRTAIGDRSIFE